MKLIRQLTRTEAESLRDVHTSVYAMTWVRIRSAGKWTTGQEVGREAMSEADMAAEEFAKGFDPPAVEK